MLILLTPQKYRLGFANAMYENLPSNIKFISQMVDYREISKMINTDLSTKTITKAFKHAYGKEFNYTQLKDAVSEWEKVKKIYDSLSKCTFWVKTPNNNHK